MLIGSIDPERTSSEVGVELFLILKRSVLTFHTVELCRARLTRHERDCATRVTRLIAAVPGGTSRH